MYKLAIADDEYMIRQGLSGLAWKEHGIDLVGTFENGIEAAEWVNSHELDILMTDIRMPGMSGLDLAKLAMGNYPNIKVILLSGYEEFEYAREAMRFGAFDYILKPSTPDAIISCVKRACEKYEQERQEQERVERLSAEMESYSVLVKPPEDLIAESKGGIRQIIQYIYAHYNTELTLAVLAEEFHYTTVYLSYYIKKETGYTFLEILNSVRMYYAARYLKETKLKNREICYRIGMADERYFGQVFKKKYGLPPYEFRKAGEIPCNPFSEFQEAADEKMV